MMRSSLNQVRHQTVEIHLDWLFQARMSWPSCTQTRRNSLDLWSGGWRSTLASVSLLGSTSRWDLRIYHFYQLSLNIWVITKNITHSLIEELSHSLELWETFLFCMSLNNRERHKWDMRLWYSDLYQSSYLLLLRHWECLWSQCWGLVCQSTSRAWFWLRRESKSRSWESVSMISIFILTQQQGWGVGRSYQQVNIHVVLKNLCR